MVVLACSDDGPANIEAIVSSINLSQTQVTLFVGDTRTVAAIVKDESGGQLDITKLDKPIVWSSSSAGVASVSDAGVITAVSAGSTTISATVDGHIATAIVTVKAVPTQVVSLAGSGQHGRVGQPLPGGVNIRLADATGGGVSAIPIEFTVVSGGGSVVPASTTTDAQGLATAIWVLGNTAGTQRLQVKAKLSTALPSAAPGTAPAAAPPADLVQEITAVADAGVATSLQLTPTSQQLAAGVQGSVTATVRDQFQNAITGATVVFSSSDRTVVEPDQGGRFIGRKIGTATISASVDGAASVASTATVTVVQGAPTTTLKISGDATVSPGVAAPMTVEIRDAGDNKVSGATVSWQLISGDGTLNTSTSTTDSNGRASATLTLSAIQGPRQVRATAGGSAATFLIETPGVVISNSSPLPRGITGTAYSTTITVAGGTTPITFSVTSGTLPTGLTLNATTGVISGTPSVVQTASFTIQAVTANPITVSKAFTLQVVAPLAITTVSPLPGGTSGTAYSTTVAATGGSTPYTWSITAGTLPTGVTLNASTGVISGTPSVSGTFTPTLQVASADGQTASQAYSLTVAAGGGGFPTLSISTATPLTAMVEGASISGVTIAATGGNGTNTWSLSGQPGWLSINASTGQLSGTAQPGNPVTFTVNVASGDGQNASKPFSVIVYPTLVITTTDPMAQGQITVAYNQTVASTGGTGTNAWSISAGALPTNTTINATTGAITGTPTTAGTFNFTVRVISGTQNITKPLSIVIIVLPPVVQTADPMPAGQIGVAYNQSLSASAGNGTYTWAVVAGGTGLPGGLTLSSGGVISGTPTTPTGTFDFNVQVTSAAQTGVKLLHITTTVPPPSITNTFVDPVIVNLPYNEPLTATLGDGVTYTWALSAGSLPAAVTLNSDGTITGTPTVAGTYNFTAQVTSGGQSSTKAFSLVVNPGFNMPAGFTLLVDRPFNTKATGSGDRGTGSFPNKVTGSEGWDDIEGNAGAGGSPNSSIVAAADDPLSPGSAMRINYPVGLPAASGPVVQQTQAIGGSPPAGNVFSSSPKDMYVRTSLRLGPAYYVGVVVNKLYFHRQNDGTDGGRGEPFLALFQNPDGTFKLAVNFQGTPDNGLGFFNATGAAASMKKNHWYVIETVLTMSSAPGAKDGTFTVYVDGSQVLQRTNVEYIRLLSGAGAPIPPVTSWAALHVSPTYGGLSGAPPNPTAFYFDIGHAFVAGKP